MRAERQSLGVEKREGKNKSKEEKKVEKAARASIGVKIQAIKKQRKSEKILDIVSLSNKD